MNLDDTKAGAMRELRHNIGRGQGENRQYQRRYLIRGQTGLGTGISPCAPPAYVGRRLAPPPSMGGVWVWGEIQSETKRALASQGGMFTLVCGGGHTAVGTGHRREYVGA